MLNDEYYMISFNDFVSPLLCNTNKVNVMPKQLPVVNMLPFAGLESTSTPNTSKKKHSKKAFCFVGLTFLFSGPDFPVTCPTARLHIDRFLSISY